MPPSSLDIDLILLLSPWMKLFRAAVIAPMDRPPIAEGGLLVDGPRIRAVGAAMDLKRDHPAAEVVDLGDTVVTPGLINAHTHLELSDASRPQRPASFVAWLIQLIQERSTLGDAAAEASAAAALRGARESLGFGVTCVGDITRFATATRRALARSPLRVVSFGEIQAMAGRRNLLESRLAEATDLSHDGWEGDSRLLSAISPHAPYSVEPHAFTACLSWARRHSRPICTHLAETVGEAGFLAEHRGELRELWRALGDWSEDVPRFAGGPVRLAQELGLLEEGSLLAHVNYADDEELDLLACGRAAVVWCPRTHEYFNHEPHRYREMLHRGVRVCLGTDSRASTLDLNVLEEARLLWQRDGQRDAQQLWRMVTLDAAEALGVGRWIGTLAAGKWADLAVWRLVDRKHPLAAILEADCPVERTWVGGRLMEMQ